MGWLIILVIAILLGGAIGQIQEERRRRPRKVWNYERNRWEYRK